MVLERSLLELWMSYLGSFDSVILPQIGEASSTSSLNHAKSHRIVKQGRPSEQTNKLDDGRMGSGFRPVIRLTAKQLISAFSIQLPMITPDTAYL